MDRTDGFGNCSITVHLRQTRQVSGGGVLFEACRVGSVDEADGSMRLNWDLGELTRMRPSMSTERVTQQLSEMLFQEDETKLYAAMSDEMYDAGVLSAVTAEDGTCTFFGLEAGAWLVHASDSSAYGPIEDTLVAVPYYELTGDSWEGPVYNADIWPKGDIIIQSDKENQKTETEKQETEKKQTEKTEQTEKGKQTEKQPQKQETQQPEKPLRTKETQQPEKPLRTQETSQSEKTGRTKKPRRTEETIQTEDTIETEKTKTKREKTSEPEKTGKKDVPSHPRTSTQSTQPVRTLDDTPISGLVCMLLSCSLVIAAILLHWKKKGRGRRERHLMFALGLGALAVFGSGGSIRAQEEGSSVLRTEGEQKIVFVNESPSSPCLTVSKEVLDAADGSRAPEGDSFVFRLFLDGARASGMRYRIFNEAGEELVDLTGDGTQHLTVAGSGGGDPVPLRCGRDGSFSLKDGQYALFEEVSAGMLWEVWELEKDHYERVIPKSSGILGGTIGRNGDHAAYVNRYVPEEEPDYSEGSLEITKKILWPEQFPLPERGNFRIRVLIDNKAWSDAPVEILDEEEGTQTVYIRTDQDGIFPIRGNQRAFLRSLPLGSDLVVEELDDPEDAFYPSGSTAFSGAVVSHGKVTITNRLADFVVSKSLRSGDPDHRFVFRLTGREREPMEGIPYYLVEEGERPDPQDVRYTDAQGHFSLSSKQKAVFTGMEEGTVYSVLEENNLLYRRVIPEDRDGYTSLTVQNGIPTLYFENEQTDGRMVVPSLGGNGIGILLALSIAGMVLCFLVFAGTAVKKRFESGRGIRF